MKKLCHNRSKEKKIKTFQNQIKMNMQHTQTYKTQKRDSKRPVHTNNTYIKQTNKQNPHRNFILES